MARQTVRRMSSRERAASPRASWFWACKLRRGLDEIMRTGSQGRVPSPVRPRVTSLELEASNSLVVQLDTGNTRHEVSGSQYGRNMVVIWSQYEPSHAPRGFRLWFLRRLDTTTTHYNFPSFSLNFRQIVRLRLELYGLSGILQEDPSPHPRSPFLHLLSPPTQSPNTPAHLDPTTF